MKSYLPYLSFDGRTREAMTFYQQVLGGELRLMTFGESPVPAPPGAGDRILHARLSRGDAVLMASDSMPGMHFSQGTNFSVSVTCESSAEVDRLHAAMAEGGRILLPVEDTFWGARFGMLTDRFGVNWMFDYEKPGS